MSKLEVDAIEPQSGTTLTLGASGDTVNIASGATITDFTSTGIDDNATSTAITINSSEQVGIGTTNPLTNLHIANGSSGATMPTGTNVFIESSGDAKLSIECPDTHSSMLILGSESDQSGSGFIYDHTDLSTTIGSSTPNGIVKITSGNSNERMRITSSGNVGIGTSSPNYPLNVQSTGDTFVGITGGDSDQATLLFGKASNKSLGRVQYENSDNSLRLWTNGSQRLRIDSSGNVIVTGSVGSGSTGRLNTRSDGGTPLAVSNESASGTLISFQGNGSGQLGSITHNGASVAYNTTSDYRLKGNVSYDFDATTRLKQLKPARFNFIADADTTVDGFIAHEVQTVVPEAISGEKDATETKEKVVVNANGKVIAENIEQADWEAGKIADEDGNTKYPTDSTWEATKVVPVYQGIDQAKLVPLLVKTIQELEARITTLENA